MDGWIARVDVSTLGRNGVTPRHQNSAGAVENGYVDTFLNIVWLVLAGVWLALCYMLAAVVMCMLIITIPFGVAAFRIGIFVLWPFGRAVVRRPDAGPASTVGNVLWFVLFGFWIAVAHVVLGIALCLTVIGIPLGLGNFKLALVAIAPLGKEIVPSSDPRTVLSPVSF
jgi:uncharacterized membrane protein YccF (DUF307 family)